MPSPAIETDRLILRLHTPEDAQPLFALQSDDEMMRHYPSKKTSIEDSREWIEWCLSHHEQHGYGLWALELKETGGFVGNCGLLKQNLDDELLTEIGYFVDKRYWGEGLATEAALASREWGFTHLDVPRLVSFIAPENLASIRVAQKTGMSWWKSGTFKGMEIGVWSITRRAFNGLKSRSG